MAGGTGTTTVDFGNHPGLNEANVVITGISGIEEREELRKEIVNIGKATPQEVVTGIVDVPRRKRAANTETIERLNASRLDAEAARMEKIRRIVAADDDWLMLS